MEKWGVRGSNPGPCINYAMSLPTELRLGRFMLCNVLYLHAAFFKLLILIMHKYISILGLLFLSIIFFSFTKLLRRSSNLTQSFCFTIYLFFSQINHLTLEI